LIELELFYSGRLGSEGWILRNRRASSNSVFGGPMVEMDFTKGENRLNVILAISDKKGYAIVTITFPS
jgi:hypothetical protein